ncbi:MAG: DNA repair protein RecN [Myxococcota bacterium]
MLLQLRIRDFAIIDRAEIELPRGFVVVTGETGAGKSIWVDALLLALGGRASTDVVRAGARSAIVEALFDISDHPQVQARLEARDLVGDDAGLLLVRRSIAAKGRGKVSINGHLATVATLGEIAQSLVDISGQHDQQSLLQVENHLEIVDAFGELDGLRSAFEDSYRRWRSLEAEKSALTGGEQLSVQRADFIRYQLEELARVDPSTGEDLALEAEQQRLGHAEKLESGVRAAEALLYGDDGSAFDKVGRASAELEALGRIDPELAKHAQSLDSARREIQEAARELLRYADRVECEPDRLVEVEGRLAELHRLMRKHGPSLDDVLARRQALQTELDSLGDIENRLSRIDDECREGHAEMRHRAGVLSKARKKVAAKLGETVSREVAEMDLEGALLEVKCGARGPEEPFGPTGADVIELLWAPNRGEPPKPLARIASGGELSRLMLAVKSVLSKRDLVSLYVFDEVDTGLGGRAADTIGQKLQRVSEDHQAIVITHLAPIAARASHHVVVRKAVRDERTVSELKVVDGRERMEEVARMIDGASASATTRKAAKEMLQRARA